MKPFENLAQAGKIRRLRRLAMSALAHYDLEVSSLAWVGFFTNSTFKLTTPGGQSYALRICCPGWRMDTDLFSEAAWLEAIHQHTDIDAPVPVKTRGGNWLVTADAPGVPESRRCTLMTWLPGSLLGKHLTPANLTKMGCLFARLHHFGAQFSPPEGFTTRRMDNVYARGEEDILFGDACRDAFTEQNRPVFEEICRRVTHAFQQLYADPSGLRVIHNDLWHDNIKVYRGKLLPFDFEDTLWGYPVQDIAMAFQDLYSAVKPDEYDRLTGAFRRGYEELAAWPEQYQGQIDTLRAGRMLWVANWMACYQRQHLAKHIEWLAPQLEQFLKAGD
jgi:Ser/Thr protein kinase RdoA (MazF antagonist)